MKAEIETAIKALATKSEKAEKSEDAQKYAQGALNLAHILATIDNFKQPK